MKMGNSIHQKLVLRKIRHSSSRSSFNNTAPIIQPHCSHTQPNTRNNNTTQHNTMGESDSFFMIMDFISPDDLMLNDRMEIGISTPDFTSPALSHPVHIYEEYEDEVRVCEELKKRKTSNNTAKSPRQLQSPHIHSRLEPEPSFIDFYHTFFFALLLVDLAILAFEAFSHRGRTPFILSTTHTLHFFMLSLLWFVVGTMLMFGIWTYNEGRKQKENLVPLSVLE
eukprot:TRINITY_DN1117_c0_g1_i5.p1 TRINITY_DN1117_c0_g1~~TRINITY_DN1117_c0_g1_i5.p1  ORF type:complete len:224 (+),score=35.87 TRINITY_DN1117_c0_g1_i5:522-1193(+)